VSKELNLSTEIMDVLHKLLEKDPAKRLGTKGGAAEIKAHPFFKGTDWAKILRREMPMPEPYLAKMAMDIIRQ
jgi:serine/threonine protein kinase